MGTALEILIILLLVLLNGAFAMSELAIVSSRRSRLMAMQKRGVRGADTALALAMSAHAELSSSVGCLHIHVWLGPSSVSNAPALFRPPKLSGTGPGQY